MNSVYLFCNFWCFVFVLGEPILPQDYIKCNFSDTSFNTCTTSSLGKLVSVAVKGMPSLGIEPLDPIRVEHAYFRTSPNTPLSMKLELKNLTFHGFNNLKVVSSNGTDLRKNIIQMIGIIPQAKAEANYTMSGKILTIPLEGSGNTVISLNNMKITYQSYYYLQKRKDKLYIAVKNMTLDTDVESGSVIYRSATKNNILGFSDNDINRVLNENFLIMYEEYKLTVNNILLNLISPRIIKFNNNVPFDMLFLT